MPHVFPHSLPSPILQHQLLGRVCEFVRAVLEFPASSRFSSGELFLFLPPRENKSGFSASGGKEVIAQGLGCLSLLRPHAQGRNSADLMLAWWRAAQIHMSHFYS